MILRPILADPLIQSLPVDPAAVFEPGQIFGIVEINGEIFGTVSDGVTIPPIGIVDDVRTSAFSGTVKDEVSVIAAPSTVTPDGKMVSTHDVMGGLQETNIIANSFTCNFDVILDPKKGTFIIPAGTDLNYDDGTTMGFEIVCSYRYQIVGAPGLDSTIGTGQVAIHFKRGTFSTNMFDITAMYSPGCPLFVNGEGMLTSQETGSPMVAIALQPSTAINGELVFMWL